MSPLSLCLLLTLTNLAADTSQAPADSVDAQVSKILAKFTGDTALAFTEIDDGQPKLLYGVRADKRMAVGSTFKLFIFGTLVDEVNHGRRRAENVMLLRPDLVGPPASEMGTWPMGSPVTLHTLALKMISISDNTATDHLLYLLGRERIEQQMVAMGHGDPAVNRPLLSTREMTMLRDKKRDMPGLAYRKLDDAARRKFLTELDSGVPDYDQLDFDTAAYNVAEWYASPIDMAHALAWIETHTRKGQPAHELLAILAVDPKLPHDAKVWPYVGFKGGSEDQLIAGNWLLQYKNSKWYTLHVYCNHPNGKVEPEQFVAALEKILPIIEKSIR